MYFETVLSSTAGVSGEAKGTRINQSNTNYDGRARDERLSGLAKHALGAFSGKGSEAKIP